MKLAAFALLTVFSFGFQAIASDNALVNGAEIIAQASEKSNIFALSSFEMKANVRLSVSGKFIDGSYLLLWSGPTHWMEKIGLPSYSEIQVGKKGLLFIERSTSVIPYPIYQLHQALGFGSAGGLATRGFNQTLRANETVRKVHERKIDGIKAECVEINTAEKYTREACVNQATGTLVRDGEGLRDRNWTSIGSKLFPGSVSFIEDGKSKVEVQITELKSGELSLPVPEPSAQAISRAGCMNPTPGHRIHSVAPHYPEEARLSRIQGTVGIYTILDKTGVPQQPQVVLSSGPSLDQASLDAVRQWRYDPDTCDGQPVDVESVIEVHYTLSSR